MEFAALGVTWSLTLAMSSFAVFFATLNHSSLLNSQPTILLPGGRIDFVPFWIKLHEGFVRKRIVATARGS